MNLQQQLELSLGAVANKALINDMIEVIKTPEFPRNTSKKFLISWLENMKGQIK